MAIRTFYRYDSESYKSLIYSIPINTTKDRKTRELIRNWIDDNIESEWDYVYGGNESTYVFRFKSKEDAMAFALKWT